MIKEGKVPYRVFVIAGSEPLGSAGIQADVRQYLHVEDTLQGLSYVLLMKIQSM